MEPARRNRAPVPGQRQRLTSFHMRTLGLVVEMAAVVVEEVLWKPQAVAVHKLATAAVTAVVVGRM